MSRTEFVVLLRVLAAGLTMVFVAVLVLWLLHEIGWVDLPGLEPVSVIISTAVTGIGGLASWLAARRAERNTPAPTIEKNKGPVTTGDASPAVQFKESNQGPVAVGSNIAITQVINQYRQEGGSITDTQVLHEQIKSYLDWVRDSYGKIELRGIKREDRPVVQLDLETVYVPLEAQVYGRHPISTEQSGEPGLTESRDIGLEQILGMGPRLVVVGGPGSGKTTVLLHIAWTLATGDSQMAQQKLGLTGTMPLPVFIPLSTYADHLQKLKSSIDPAEKKLAVFISRYLHGKYLPRDFFETLMHTGEQIILLLDGLDEIPEEDLRAQVREKIEELVQGRDHIRIVVSCRTAAYQGRTALGKGFREIRVKPLEDAHIESLVRQAYEHIYRHDPQRQQERADDLLRGIMKLEADRRRRSGEKTERLVSSPLMVRMLLVVHLSDQILPEQRAELYMKATDAMLLPEYIPDEEVVAHIGRLVGGSREIHRDLAQHLAFHMHTRGERQGREIDEGGLKQILSADPNYAPLVRDFIALTRLRGTLLEERFGTYRFIHLSFQEFLAARYLAEIKRGEGGVEAIATFLEEGPILDSWWREPALLVAGYLSFTSTPTAQLFLRRLAGLDAQAVQRNHQLADDVQLAAAEIVAVSLLEWQPKGEDLQKAVSQRLAALLTDPRLTVAPTQRALAGEALSRLGDPRPDVNCAIPDMVDIPAGPFWMGSDKAKDDLAYDDEQPQHEVDLPAYRIGRYPVTVAQFRHFKDAGGYDNQAYWTPAGWDWRGKKNISEPRFWDDPRWTIDNHPVVGVSWYEAVAYCNWLKATTGRDFRLPDEAMWEKAARGTDGRIWPWGDAWDANKLNSYEGEIRHTSAVGIFPAGKSLYGIYDAGGNVWEWCSGASVSETPYPFRQKAYEDDLLASPTFRSLRGGAWGSSRSARAAYRNLDNPDDGDDYVGFRVAEHLSHSVS